MEQVYDCGSPQVGQGDAQMVSLGFKVTYRQPWKQPLPICQSAFSAVTLVSTRFPMV